MSALEPDNRGAGCVFDDTPGLVAVYGQACAVAECQCVVVGVEGKWIGVVAAQHIAAESESGVGQTELCQQSSRKVSLVGEYVYRACTIDGTSCP